jgi:hypothetical protein
VDIDGNVFSRLYKYALELNLLALTNIQDTEEEEVDVHWDWNEL